MIVSRPLVWLSTSGPAVNTIVWAVAKTVGSNVIVWAPGRTSARSTAPRRSSCPAGAVPSLVVLTTSGRWAGLEGADVDRAIQREAALVGGDAADGDALADGRAAGEQGHGLGRAPVEGQRSQSQAGQAGQDDVAVCPLMSPPEPPVPIRLWLPVTVPLMSLAADEGPVLPATIVSVSVTVP